MHRPQSQFRFLISDIHLMNIDGFDDFSSSVARNARDYRARNRAKKSPLKERAESISKEET
jgi:hypothetical protein